jgi:hypothetical protein
MDDKLLRKQLIDMLRGGDAHLTFEEVVSGLPPGKRAIRLHKDVPTAWQLLEHLRIAQWDILEFSRNPKHVSPEFPGGYWPKEDAPPNNKAWTKSVRIFNDDLREMQDLIADESTDVSVRIPHGTGQTVLREGLVLAQHNSYHLGQLVLIRKMLDAW